MLKTRIYTAAALLAGVMFLGALGIAWLVTAAAVFLGVALFEWLRLARVGTPIAAAAAAIAAAAAWLLDRMGFRPAPAALAAVAGGAVALWFAIAGVLVAAQRRPADRAMRIPDAISIAAALVLGGAAWLCVARLLHQGAGWTLSVLALVWLADAAAYFTGRSIGRHKLASRISPGKTWEGVGGAVVAVALCAWALRLSSPGADLWPVALLRATPVGGTAILVVFVALSVVGDLFESLVKRQAGVKDSGTILPGHGGVWDRIDATLPAVALAVFAQWWLMRVS